MQSHSDGKPSDERAETMKHFQAGQCGHLRFQINNNFLLIAEKAEKKPP
jgi:hypothetical protein